MKVMKGIFKTLFCFVFCLVYSVFESLKYIVKGSSVVGRITIFAGYVGLVTLAVFKPIAFRIVPGIILIVEMIWTFIVLGSEKTDSEKSQSEKENIYNSQKIPFFDGMSFEDAKREYRRLMKQYHPDNVGGDVEMSQKITAAYNQYKSFYGR